MFLSCHCKRTHLSYSCKHIFIPSENPCAYLCCCYVTLSHICLVTVSTFSHTVIACMYLLCYCMLTLILPLHARLWLASTLFVPASSLNEHRNVQTWTCLNMPEHPECSASVTNAGSSFPVFRFIPAVVNILQWSRLTVASLFWEATGKVKMALANILCWSCLTVASLFCEMPGKVKTRQNRRKPRNRRTTPNRNVERCMGRCGHLG